MFSNPTLLQYNLIFAKVVQEQNGGCVEADRMRVT